jgi:uncharacterized repeat protein (TIGR01451 family)
VLVLAIEQNPPFAWQGQEVILTFTVTNKGERAATNVQLRNELPVELRFVEGQASSGATLTEEEVAEGRLAFVVAWPRVAPGQSQTATVRVQIQAPGRGQRRGGPALQQWHQHWAATDFAANLPVAALRQAHEATHR